MTDTIHDSCWQLAWSIAGSCGLAPAPDRFSPLGRLRANVADGAIADFDAALNLDAKLASARYGRGLAKMRKNDIDGGNADIAAAKAIKTDIAEEFYRPRIASEAAADGVRWPLRHADRISPRLIRDSALSTIGQETRKNAGDERPVRPRVKVLAVRGRHRERHQPSPCAARAGARRPWRCAHRGFAACRQAGGDVLAAPRALPRRGGFFQATQLPGKRGPFPCAGAALPH